MRVRNGLLSPILFLLCLLSAIGPLGAEASSAGDWTVHTHPAGLDVQFGAGSEGFVSNAGLGIRWVTGGQSGADVANGAQFTPARVLTNADWREHREGLRLESVFPHIDVVVHGEQGVPEFDFLVQPGADPSGIAYRFESDSVARLLPSGALLVTTGGRQFTQRPPLAWQTVNGAREMVPVAFRIHPSGEVGFQVGSYRHNLLLVIDPTVEFSSYVAKDGASSAFPDSMAVAPNGDIFVLARGNAASVAGGGAHFRPLPDLPEPLALIRLRAGTHEVLSRTSLPLSTSPFFSLLRGPLLAVDEAGSPWVAFETDGTLPTQNPTIGNINPGTSRILLMRLSPDASSITHSRHIGCDLGLTLTSLDAGKGNGIVLAAHSMCSNFPISEGAYAGNLPEAGPSLRTMLVKLNATSGEIVYTNSLFRHGTQIDPNPLAVLDSTGRTIVASVSNLETMPVTPGALYSTLQGPPSVHLAAISANGSTLEFGTYLPSNDLTGLSIGPQDSIYLMVRGGAGYPLTAGAFVAPTAEGWQHYVSRIRKDGAAIEMSALVYRTPYSGSVSTTMALTPDGGAVFVANEVTNLAALTADSFAPKGIYLGSLSADGTTLRFGSGIPSREGLLPQAVLVTNTNRVLIAGHAGSNSLARTPNAWATYPDSSVTDMARPGFFMAVDMLSPSNCAVSASISPSPIGFGRDPGTLSVATDPGCPWLVDPPSPDTLRFSEYPSKVGSGPVPFNSLPNLSLSERNFQLAIGERTFSFTQAAGQCSFFEVDPPSLTLGPNQSVQQVQVRTPHGCSWSPSASTFWFVEPNFLGVNGSPIPELSGSFAFSFGVAANSFDTRSGSVMFGPQAFTLTQTGAGCAATVSPQSFSFPVDGGSGNLTLQTAGTNCQWSAVGGPGVSFPSGFQGTGSANVPIQFSPNPGNSPRESFVYLANRRVPITQSAGQCTASFPNAVAEAPQVGGYVTVPFQASGDSCAWNVTVNQPWLRFLGGGSSGSGSMTFEVDANRGMAAREAIISNLGQSAILRQLGNNAALLEINGPSGFWVKINGVKEFDPPARSYPIGTSLTIEPQDLQVVGSDTLYQTLGWQDLPQKKRTVVLNTNFVRLDLLTQRLFRVAEETVPGGRIEFSSQMISSQYPEFYVIDPGFNRPEWAARPIPNSGYRFAGWLLDNMQTYRTEELRTTFDGTGPFLRPRFAPLDALSQPHFLPASLALTAYPEGDETSTMVEFRLPSGGSATLLPHSCSGNVFALHTQDFSPIQGGYRLQLRTNHQQLLLADGGLVDCTVSARANATGQTHSLPLKIRVEGGVTPPGDGISAVTNAATFLSSAIAPDSLFTLFGQNLAAATEHATTIPLPELLGGAQVRILSEVDFANRGAGLLYVSPTQINFHVPDHVPEGNARVQLFVNGQQVSDVPVQVARSSPGIFRVDVGSGRHAPAGYGTLVSGSMQLPVPIYQCAQDQTCTLERLDPGGATDELFLTLFGTGLRNLSAQDIRLEVNGVSLPVEFLGAHSYFVGLDQINVRVPASLRGAGEASLLLRMGTFAVNAGQLSF